MDIPKFIGYYIDTNTNHYNTFGQINGEWKDGVRYYIDVNKKVTLEENYLAEARSNSTGDELYEPIGSRVEKRLINMVVFGSFSISKTNATTVPNEYGILLSGGIKISLEPKEGDVQSKTFYENYNDIRNKFNQNNTIVVGSLFSENSYFELPGLDPESLRVLNENPTVFIQNYCKETNDDYTSFKKFISKIGSLFNILSWSIEGKLISAPGIVLIISKAYYDINQVRANNGKPKLEFFLNLPCDLDGINPVFTNQWERNFIQMFMDTSYQKPMFLGFLTQAFNPVLFQKAFDENNVLESVVNAPFSDGIHQNYTGKSSDVVKSLLGSSDMDFIKSRSFLIPYINHYEPSNAALKKEISTMINEGFIKELSMLLVLKGLNGIILFQDRGDNQDSLCISHQRINPATIKYDESISLINSIENQEKTKLFLNTLNNNNK
ncbi:hypothetical protein DICPUDRAFT_150977 [Dictyostelium purpureum]|uniref:Uncharacterized protein n=1 Tax=Dictyostelium purpureum TaxID=5786 RepID=F0ZHQ1_DICPU|nr:uncharacterized protein DICPUDRAFT_150977 [Dictyostelium purpureum]EGC36499.1 hypothetical protein DICPUDRAFT_150977 [Dictyostelium purpureum]|eukprot:XP_003286944.1 hypothetical protein DICPUDRAFT_150977 [Dictyostelium purpureum]